MKGITPSYCYEKEYDYGDYIAGAAYTYISSYTFGITGKAAQKKDAFCDSDSSTAKIFLQNIGTQSIDVPMGFISDSSLVYLARFDSPPGTNTLRDYSGRGNDGSLVNMNTGTAWVQGKVGNALEFSGNNPTGDHVLVPHDASLAIADEVCIGGWVNMGSESADGDYYQIMSRYDGASENYGLWIIDIPDASSNPTAGIEFSRGGTFHEIMTAPDITAGSWHHVVACYKGSADSGTVYLDGTVNSTGSSGATGPLDSSLGMKIGFSPDDGLYSFGGRIDNLFIYNRILTPG